MVPSHICEELKGQLNDEEHPTDASYTAENKPLGNQRPGGESQVPTSAWGIRLQVPVSLPWAISQMRVHSQTGTSLCKLKVLGSCSNVNSLARFIHGSDNSVRKGKQGHRRPSRSIVCGKAGCSKVGPRFVILSWATSDQSPPVTAAVHVPANFPLLTATPGERIPQKILQKGEKKKV